MTNKEKTTVYIGNGKCVAVSNLNINDKKASAIIHGRRVEVLLKDTPSFGVGGRSTKESMAKRALHAKWKELYGDDDVKVRRTRVKNLGNGVSIATAEVDGNVVQETFIGSVSDSDGNVMEAKPWLGDVRRRLVDKTEGKAPEKLFTRTSDLVDILFIKKLVEAKLNVDAPNQVVRIGNEIIRLSGLTQVEATLEIKAAIDRFKAERAENTKLVEDFFKEIAA